MINENYVNHEINISDNSFSNSYTYDNNFNMISTTNKFGDTTSYNYDNMNRLSKVSMSGYNFTYNYDPYTNNISSIVYPNGTTYQFAFDSRNRLTNQNVSHPGTIWESEGYTYDNNSNIIVKTHNGTSNSYAYDKLNRLITTNNVTNNNIVNYEYDSRSNISKEYSNNNIDFELSTGSYTWNGLGQLTSFTDSSNQVYSYKYDLNGMRSQKLKPGGSYTNYYYNKGGSLLADDNNGVKSSYIIGTFPLAKITNGNIYYYIYNTHNDLKYITDSNGTIINEYTYDIWGKTTILREGIQNEIGYTSQIYDRESDNYYLRARYYNPQTKRFISKDSYEGTIENPVSHNMYIYCLNNPMIYSDPSGRSASDLRSGDFGGDCFDYKGRKIVLKSSVEDVEGGNSGKPINTLVYLKIIENKISDDGEYMYKNIHEIPDKYENFLKEFVSPNIRVYGVAIDTGALYKWGVSAGVACDREGNISLVITPSQGSGIAVMGTAQLFYSESFDASGIEDYEDGSVGIDVDVAYFLALGKSISKSNPDNFRNQTTWETSRIGLGKGINIGGSGGYGIKIFESRYMDSKFDYKQFYKN